MSTTDTSRRRPPEGVSYRLMVKFILLTTILIAFNCIQLNKAEEEADLTTQSEQLECSQSDANSVKCQLNKTCVYGELNTVSCKVDDSDICKGNREFQVTFPCLYCWQLHEDSYNCITNTTCKSHTRYLTTCSVNKTTYCLGNRVFSKYNRCNFSSGHKRSIALVLSYLFGGFGLDRFYLGHWQEGIGKLFSFGGFGIWTLIDAILIGIGYLKPADSSQYEL